MLIVQQEVRVELHKRETAVKQLHDRSRACFRQLRQANRAAGLPSRPRPSLDEVQQADMQPVPLVTPAQSAEQLEAEQVTSAEVKAPWPSPSVKGIPTYAALISLLSTQLLNTSVHLTVVSAVLPVHHMAGAFS